MRKTTRILVAAALAVVGLPVLLLLTVVVAFYALFYFPNRTTARPGAIVSSSQSREYPSRMPDVLFIAQLIDALAASYNLDRTRIYADGLSNGGGMAFALSCTIPDRIAAVGMVSAARSLDWSWCRDHRPVPAIAFHGTADAVVPYAGGPTPVGPDVFPGVLAFTAEWARRNGCGPEPVESAVAPDVTRLEYTGCVEDAAVMLFTVKGGGHQWPGGRPLPEFLAGPYTRSIDATRQMWAFFREHPRR